MTLRKEQKIRKESRKWAERQYVKHRRHNMAFAKPGIHDFVIILDNLKPSFNIGKIFRSADAFGANSIHLVGTDYFEVKPAKGSFKWIPAFYHSTFSECYTSLNGLGYSMFVMEANAETQLHQAGLPRKSGFIFGHEEYGISFSRSDYPNISSMKIPQVGRVESLNVSVAASIVMYEYFRQHQKHE